MDVDEVHCLHLRATHLQARIKYKFQVLLFPLGTLPLRRVPFALRRVPLLDETVRPETCHLPLVSLVLERPVQPFVLALHIGEGFPQTVVISLEGFHQMMRWRWMFGVQLQFNSVEINGVYGLPTGPFVQAIDNHKEKSMDSNL